MCTFNLYVLYFLRVTNQVPFSRCTKTRPPLLRTPMHRPAENNLLPLSILSICEQEVSPWYHRTPEIDILVFENESKLWISCFSRCSYFFLYKKSIVLFKLKVQSHYGISVYASVCSYARIRSQKLIYVRSTLRIRRVRFEYADIRQRTLCYTQRPNYFYGHVQNLSAYASAQNIRYSYANHAHLIRWIR